MSKGLQKSKSLETVRKSKTVKKEEGRHPLDSFIDVLLLNVNEVGGLPPNIRINNDEAVYNEGNKSLPVVSPFYKPGSHVVHELKLRHNKMDIKLLHALNFSFGTLRDLCFEYCNLTEDHIHHIKNVLQSNEQITRLSLNGNPNPSQNHSIVLQNTNLKILSLQLCKIDIRGLEQLSEQLSKDNQTLVSLNLAGNFIDDRAINSLIFCLRINRTLVAVNICDNLITSIGLLSLLGVFKSFPLMHNEIVIRRHRVVDTLIRGAESQMEVVPNVRDSVSRKKSDSKKSKETTFSAESSIRLIKCRHPFVMDCTPESGEIICKGNNSLRHLNIAYNEITTEVLQLIIDVINYQKSNFLKLDYQSTGLSKIILGDDVSEKFPTLTETITNLLVNRNLSRRTTSATSSSVKLFSK